MGECTAISYPGEFIQHGQQSAASMGSSRQPQWSAGGGLSGRQSADGDLIAKYVLKKGKLLE